MTRSDSAEIRDPDFVGGFRSLTETDPYPTPGHSRTNLETASNVTSESGLGRSFVDSVAESESQGPVQIITRKSNLEIKVKLFWGGEVWAA